MKNNNKYSILKKTSPCICIFEQNIIESVKKQTVIKMVRQWSIFATITKTKNDQIPQLDFFFSEILTRNQNNLLKAYKIMCEYMCNKEMVSKESRKVRKHAFENY